MQTSPWIILGSTAILLIVVLVLAYQNTNRERRYMSELLRAKGAALIRAVEAGARTGMMGMMWGGRQVQRLLEETARLSDVRYMAVVDQTGRAVAHSDPSKAGQPFDPKRKIAHLGPNRHENWELVTLAGGQRIFEVHRHFRPINAYRKHENRQMQRMMRHHPTMLNRSDDWFDPEKQHQLLIVVGLDVTPFEDAIRSDLQTTVILSVVMLLLGFGGFVSLFWMHSYRTAKKSLEDTSAFADEVVSHLPVGLVATDASGRITFFNEAAEKITGLKRTGAQNQTADTLLPDGLCDVQQSLDQGMEIVEKEMECTFAGSRNVPLSVSATRIDNEAGEFVGQVLIMRDLREIRRLQDEIRRQEKLAAVGGLAAGVAHEVRNPLSSIKALASFFSGQFAEGSHEKEAAGVMVQEVDRLNRAITELLDFARPSDLRREASDINELISRSIKLIQQDAVNKKIEIEVDTADDRCPVWVDPDRLAQCLLNLYLNAVQAMDAGGTLTVQCSAAGAAYAKIVVRDTGRGIAPTDLNRIFNPYFTTKKTGTGLGLAVVHKIIEAHKGHIDVTSNLGEGTTFTLFIPCNISGDTRGDDDIAQNSKSTDRR